MKNELFIFNHVMWLLPVFINWNAKSGTALDDSACEVPALGDAKPPKRSANKVRHSDPSHVASTPPAMVLAVDCWSSYFSTNLRCLAPRCPFREALCRCCPPSVNAGRPLASGEEQEAHVRVAGAFETPDTLASCTEFLRAKGVQLQAKAVLSIVPKSDVGFPRVS